MPLNFHFCLATIIALGLIWIPLAFAMTIPTINYNTSLVDMKVIDLQILPLDDTPNYPSDDSDLLKVTINMTNNGVDYFLVSDKMFKIWVMEPDLRKDSAKDGLKIVDNYYTSRDDELAVRYDNLHSRELFEECDRISDIVRIGQSKVFTACYDVLRIWNNEILNIDGAKKYYLVMMNNDQATSCPNCKKILLSTPELSHIYQIPAWVQNLEEWHKQGIVSDREYQDSIEYLVAAGVIPEAADRTHLAASLEDKNRQLKERQARLSLAEQTNLYVSSINFYESEFDDKVFGGVLCKKQNNIATLSGDYTNDESHYKAIFLKLQLFDGYGNVVAEGLSKMIDVVPKEFRHFSVSTPYNDKVSRCLVTIDSKFP